MNQKPKLKAIQDTKTEADGRRQRSQKSRRKVLRAIWEIMLNGDMEPGAPEISEKSGVSLRTVYRHLEDMDAIYRELVLAAEESAAPIQLKPYKSLDWKDQLIELTHRTVEIWNHFIVPHTACEIRRFKSEILMDEYRRSRMRELSAIKAVLPEGMEGYDKLLNSLDGILCFSMVRRLRQDRSYSLKKTKDIMTHMVQALIKNVA
jgi:AcrR family transcriptional regulator